MSRGQPAFLDKKFEISYNQRMHFEFEIIARLLLAAFFGALIGVEREYRAKEAGLRTHFLVCAGSALFTIVSIHGFGGVGEFRHDAARVAAQIVTGIGFIGAGTIVIHKRFVIGLTTAAGLWATAAIGMATGCGMYALAGAGAILTLAGLELLRRISHRIGNLKRQMEVTYITNDSNSARDVADKLKTEGYDLKSYASSRALDGRVRVRLALEIPDHLSAPSRVFDFFKDTPDAELEGIE